GASAALASSTRAKVIETSARIAGLMTSRERAENQSGLLTMKRKIIIDTDPGQDVAVAILLALASPEELDVLGIVAVGGNVPLARTENNARRIVELAGRPEVPVYAGCVGPMVRRLVTAEHVHGRTGLVGIV